MPLMLGQIGQFLREYPLDRRTGAPWRDLPDAFGNRQRDVPHLRLIPAAELPPDRPTIARLRSKSPAIAHPPRFASTINQDVPYANDV